MTSSRLLQLMCTGLLMVIAGTAGAQSAATYPNKPVRVIIPFAPGGAAGIVLKVWADIAGAELGQNFIADYRPGGDTVVGVGAAAKAAPDGYTLLLGTSSYLTNHFMTPNLPFDTLKDLAPVAMLGRSTYVMVAHPSVASSLGEFVSKAKARPGELNVAYVGSVALLNFHIFMNVAGVKLTPVSYKATPQASTALLSAEVASMMSGLSTVQPLIKAGKLKAIAVTGDQRMPLLPDVPTLAEAGVKFSSSNWFALLAPTKTPRDIIEKLNVHFRKAQAVPEAMSMLNKINIDSFPATVDETEKFLRSEADLYGRVVKASGIKAGGN